MLRRRRLPHLDIPGRAQFVTFRLHGSLPAHRAFPPASMTSGEAFLAMDRILDQARRGPVFLRQPEIAQTVLDSIECGITLGHYHLHSWVIMPNHIHLLLTPQVSLPRLLGSLKAATAKRANLLLGRTGQPFWQEESYDHRVRGEEEFRRIGRYIETNPVSAGLAADPQQYAWSSGAQRAVTPSAP